ncbi:LapA family protein [Rhodospirillaceae bacterium SYSU D60014]|uniref:lipopolysaccharide assembly protein LapA domain-containing protein n=1 Tax=Virgifigura deserti TaxID=2268457 RepID=UPI000E66A5D4
MKHFSWIFTVPVTAIVVLFAITNRSLATLSFWPLPWEMNLPIYLIILSALFVGFMLGAVVAWLSGGRRRRQTRQLAEQVRAQSRQIAELQRRQAEASAAATFAASPAANTPANTLGGRQVLRVAAR